MDATFEELLVSRITGSKIIIAPERHLLDAPNGKRVRPKFLLACARLLNVAEKEVLESAIAVELMHTGSLVHDDIIDKADERRSRPSVNKLYGNTMALLAGDGLLAHALLSFASIKKGTKATKQAAKTFIELTDAMAVEASLDPREATPADTLKIADGKTGALFGLCGYLAGLAADDLDAAKRLNLVGRLAGRAFQIRDDVDDLKEDIDNCVPTLPQLLSPDEVERVIQTTLQEAVTQLRPYIQRPDYTELVADIYMLARTPQPIES